VSKKTILANKHDMAENFSYFSYNNNLERSFLSSLSQILQENDEEESTIQELEEEQITPAQLLAALPKHSPATQLRAVQERGKETAVTPMEEKEDEEDSRSSQSGTQSSESEDSSSALEDSEKDERILVQIQNHKKTKSHKIVPLPKGKTEQRRRVQFRGDVADNKADVLSDSSEEGSEHSNDIKEVEIEEGNNELEALVKQLVLLENEANKAQQLLKFIQQHSCFDKQDHKAIWQFIDMIEQEKKSLVVVLSNFSPQVQPLITMMTISERRLSLLDTCSYITPGSTLHTTFLEKQQSLQDVIDQATVHVYGRQ
jgi:hypothetical protein